MKPLSNLVACALAAFGLAACDGAAVRDLKPGVSTADDVRARLGAPGLEWRNDDGSVTWEYSRQPMGSECLMATIAADGRLVSLENVLTPENLSRIGPGWTQDQVRRLIGKPKSKQVFRGGAEEVWDWRLPPEPGAEIFFNVHFGPDGRVVKTSRTIEARG